MDGLTMQIENFIQTMTVNYGNGRGNGGGHGNGYGYGGNGYGYGYGGNGSGYGYGNGGGHGNGNGSGNGYGYGHGDGNGHGRGYGNGNGYGIKSINEKKVYQIDGIPTVFKHIRGNIAKGYTLIGIQQKPCYIVKNDRFFAHGETLAEATEALQEKEYADKDIEERIAEFIKAFPYKNKKYPAKQFYTWHNRLTGSCVPGRKAFAQNHNIDIEKGKMTVAEFIKLTKSAWGGGAIERLEERLKSVGG